MMDKHTHPVHLYLPIEIKVRELHGKLLLALVAAESGLKVIIGHQKELRKHLSNLPPGIYLDKSITVSKERWFERFRKLGNTMLAWDEEGLVIHEDQYLKSRVSRKSFDQVELFFSWGQVQRNILVDAAPRDSDKILLAGNPRFDMLRPELRSFYSGPANQLINNYGKIILINTNFGFFNHFKGVDEGKRIFLKSSSHTGEGFIDKWIIYQEQLFSYFVDAIRWLSQQFQDFTIVVRAHPSENEDEWRSQVGNLKNVVVSKKGNVIEWIAASKVVIHSNCTTGIEAFLMDIPTLAYRPVQSSIYETFLPNAVSENVFSFPELQEIIQDILEDDQDKTHRDGQKAEEASSRYISHIHGDLAADYIVAQIIRLITLKEMHGVPCHSKTTRLKQQLLEKMTDLKDTILSCLPHYQKAEQYDREKFPTTNLEEMVGYVDTMKKTTDRFADIKITGLGEACFIIQDNKQT